MFGLPNFRGSCWVNACLQGIFRIPELQTRYSNDKADPENKLDLSIQRIWDSKGTDGLRDFFNSVKAESLPAGSNVGDSHELFVYLCDKLPFLDKVCRFKVADSIKCSSCDYIELKEDSLIEFSIHPTKKGMNIVDCVADAVSIKTNPDWKCEKCSNKGCTQQLLLGEFPKTLVFHVTSVGTSIEYSSVVIINKIKYCLLSVISYNGAHWWAYSRDMPPGKPWYTIDDTRVREHRSDEFPMSETMRVLIYYRLDE